MLLLPDVLSPMQALLSLLMGKDIWKLAIDLVIGIIGTATYVTSKIHTGLV